MQNVLDAWDVIRITYSFGIIQKVTEKRIMHFIFSSLKFPKVASVLKQGMEKYSENV